MESDSRALPAYVPGHQLLAGRAVLLTAAAGAGIGFAAAKKALEEGAACVVISDIHEGRLSQAVEALQAISADAKVVGVVANVTDEAAVQHLVSEAERVSGGIDVLINNAGRLTFFMWILIRASFAAASSSNQPTRIFPGWPIQPYSQKGTSR